LQDLNNIEVFQSNNAIILQRHGDVKRMLKDYQGALEDLDKVDVLEPDNAITLRCCGHVKKVLEDYQ
jgi:hypothetical protein